MIDKHAEFLQTVKINADPAQNGQFILKCERNNLLCNAREGTTLGHNILCCDVGLAPSWAAKIYLVTWDTHHVWCTVIYNLIVKGLIRFLLKWPGRDSV